MDDDTERTTAEDTSRVGALRDALTAADVKRLVRASRENDGDEVERIRRRHLHR